MRQESVATHAQPAVVLVPSVLSLTTAQSAIVSQVMLAILKLDVIRVSVEYLQNKLILYKIRNINVTFV